MILSDNMRGAAAMVGAMTAFTVNDAFMKTLGDELPLFQALALRGLAASVMLVVLARVLGQWRLDLPRRDWGLMTIRAVAEMAGAWTFITALFHMPIGAVSAILQALPLTITLAGALILGEVVGWRRMVAILVGFCGVMLIVRPGTDGFTIHALYALACVACVTVRDIVSRMLDRATPSLMVATTSAIGVTAFALAGAAFVDWQPMTGSAWLRMGGSALFLIGGYSLSVAAVRQGQMAFVAPFRYTGLLVALVIGVLVFDEIPDGWMLTGAAIVVATGLYTLYREQMRARAAGTPPLAVMPTAPPGAPGIAIPGTRQP